MGDVALVDAARRIAETLEDRREHAVVLAFGAAQGSAASLLAELFSQLPTGERLIWHQLSLHGIDPTHSFAPRRVLVVLGFEDVEWEQRVEALIALNRGRDILVQASTRLVVLLPADMKEAVFDHCADLLAWRDLVLDVPGTPGLEELAALPPWDVVRDLVAGRAVALLQPWLADDEAAPIRQALLRLPWLAMVDCGGDAASLRAMGLKVGTREEDLDSVFWPEPPIVPGAPEAWWLSCDREDVWRDEETLLVRVVAVGLGGLGDSDFDGDEASGLDVGPEPGIASLDALPSRGRQLRRLAARLAMVELALSRPSPPRWSAAPPLTLSRPTTAQRRAACLVFGPDPVVDLDLSAEWRSPAETLERIRGHSDDLADRRLFDAALEDLTFPHGPGRLAVARLLHAHALETEQPEQMYAPLLADAGDTIVVTGPDRMVEATLAALGRPFRSACSDADLGAPPGSGDVLILRPFGDALRPRSLRWGKELSKALEEQPALMARLQEALAGPAVFIAFSPADPRLRLLLRMQAPETPSLVAVVPPHVRQQLEALEVEGLEVVSDWIGTSRWDRRPRVEALHRSVGHFLEAPRGFGARPWQAPEPPFAVPSDDYGVRSDLTDALWGKYPGGPFTTLPEALVTHSRLRVAGPAGAGLWIFVQLLLWSVELRRSTRLECWPWRDLAPAEVESATLIDLREDPWLRLDEGLAGLASERGQSRLVVIEGLAEQTTPQREALLRRIEERSEVPGLRLMILDAQELPWPDDCVIPSVTLRPRHSMPARWFGWVLRDHAAGRAVLPVLEEMARAHGPVAEFLRRPSTAWWLEERLADPVDPGSPAFLAEMVRAWAAWGPRGVAPQELVANESWSLSAAVLLLAQGDPIGLDIEAELRGLGVTRPASGAEPREVALAHDLVRAQPLMDPGAPMIEGVLAWGRAAQPEYDPRAWLRALIPVTAPKGHGRSVGTGAAGVERRRPRLSAFAIDAVPATWARYSAFVKAGGYMREELWSAEGWRWRTAHEITGPERFEEDDLHPAAPVTGVSWYEADAYVRWERKRLPTEAEWEAAAWLGSSAATGDTRPLPVGQRPTARPGLPIYDMGGGVLEWCGDWYDALYPEYGAQVDPSGPPRGVERSCRGPAFWAIGPAKPLLDRRWHFPPETRRPDLGFRGASTLAGRSVGSQLALPVR